MSLFDFLPKNLPFSQKETEVENYFTLNITHHSLIGALWSVRGHNLQIKSSSQMEFSPDDDLVEAANQILDETLGSIVPEPTKILFGVPDSWLQDDNLKEEYLKLLRHVVKELDLTPMAYVSTPYAISHLLQKQSGVPITAILVDINNPITVSVVKGGKILGSKIRKRGESLSEDIEKALLSFDDVEVLPSKMLLYSADDQKGELSGYKDEMQSFSWMSNLPFLHLPKIEVLDELIEMRAVCFAGGSEIEPNISPNIQVAIMHPATNSPVHNGKQLQHNNLEEVGFVAGDIEGTEEELPSDEFDVEEDYDPAEMIPSHNPPAAPSGLIKRAHQRSIVSHQDEHPSATEDSSFLARVINLPATILGTFAVGRPRAGHGGFFGFLFQPKVLVILMLIIVGLVAAYLLVPQAKVTVYIDPKVLEREAQIVADPTITTIDETGKKIPGKVIETDVTGSDKGSATGKKQIGESAKGKVILRNKTNASKTFAKGTVLTGPSSLSYVLENQVSIASQSALEAGISYGTAVVDVTASQIGPDSNLSAGKDLTIKGENADNFSAKVDQDIAGGTSKDVTIVTADDQKRLLATLTSSLRQKAQQDIQGKLTDGMKILSEALVENITKTTYTKAVGDQSADFSLTLVVKYKGTAYQDNDLKQIASKLVEFEAPEGYTLSINDAEMQTDVVKIETDNRLIFQAKFRAKLMPKIDTEKMRKELTGKTPSQVAEIVRSYDNVIGSDIKTSYILPSALQRMPILAKNITIEVVTK